MEIDGKKIINFFSCNYHKMPIDFQNAKEGGHYEIRFILFCDESINAILSSYIIMGVKL